MEKRHLQTLEREEEERLRALEEKWSSGGSIVLEDIFRYDRTRILPTAQNALIPAWERNRILVALPFHSRLIVPMCACQQHAVDVDSIVPLLDTGAVIPALYAPYTEYPPKLVAQIIKYPHLSFREYTFFRRVRLRTGSGGSLCSHCVDKRWHRSKSLIEGKYPESMTENVRRIFSNVHPFIYPDYDLLDDVVAALRDDDTVRVRQLYDLSYAVYRLRTNQAFSSTLDLPLDRLEEVARYVPELGELAFQESLQHARDLVAEGLGLTVPVEGDIGKYVATVLSHRDDVQRLVDAVLADTVPPSGGVSTAALLEKIAVINEEIRHAEGSLRYKAIEASVGFMLANKGITAAVLSAVALGMAGSLLGCSASLAAGVAGRVAAKGGRLNFRPSPALQDIKKEVKRALEPSVQAVLSKYLNINQQAVRVWRLRAQVRGRR